MENEGERGGREEESKEARAEDIIGQSRVSRKKGQPDMRLSREKAYVGRD